MGFPKDFLWGGVTAANQCKGGIYFGKCTFRCISNRFKLIRKCW